MCWIEWTWLKNNLNRDFDYNYKNVCLRKKSENHSLKNIPSEKKKQTLFGYYIDYNYKRLHTVSKLYMEAWQCCQKETHIIIFPVKKLLPVNACVTPVEKYYM